MAENIVSQVYNTTYDFLAKTFSATKTALGDIYTVKTLPSGYTGIQLAHDPVRPGVPPVEGANVTIWYYNGANPPTYKGTQLQEIFTGTPLVGQYRVDYGETTDGYATGQVRMNPTDLGVDLVVDMNHIGSILEWGNITRLVLSLLSTFGISDAPAWTETTVAPSARAADARIDSKIGALSTLAIRGHITGLEISPNATTPATKLDVAAGYATDDTAAIIAAGPAWTLNLGATFVAGNGNGKLDTGTLTVSTTYHIFLISNATGSLVDYLASMSPTAPTMPTGYTLKRRIGSRQTDAAGNLIDVIQTGIFNRYKNRIFPIVGVAISTAGALYSVGTPTGLPLLIEGILAPGLSVSNYMEILVTCPNGGNPLPVNDVLINGFVGDAGSGSTGTSNTITTIMELTDTSGQLRFRRTGAYSGTGSQTTFQTKGYIDHRGAFGGV